MCLLLWEGLVQQALDARQEQRGTRWDWTSESQHDRGPGEPLRAMKLVSNRVRWRFIPSAGERSGH